MKRIIATLAAGAVLAIGLGTAPASAGHGKVVAGVIVGAAVAHTLTYGYDRPRHERVEVRRGHGHGAGPVVRHAHRHAHHHRHHERRHHRREARRHHHW